MSTEERAALQAMVDHHGNDSDGTTSGWWRYRIKAILAGLTDEEDISTYVRGCA